ncbi:RNA ligase family protein [Streptomyces decoyicus]
MTVTFTEWPKTPRLFRSIIVTEKIDGTNAAIHINPVTEVEAELSDHYIAFRDGQHYEVVAQSRKRLITPEKDNFGFARWVTDHASQLVQILGPGLHFGEWWGKGIQRGYGLDYRVFSLFNTDRWFKTGPDGLDSMATRAELSYLAGQVRAVPVLYQGGFAEWEIADALYGLRVEGSKAAPDFMDPEGICVFHSQSRNVFKATLDGNDSGKWEL